jgi:hypothetical protein
MDNLTDKEKEIIAACILLSYGYSYPSNLSNSEEVVALCIKLGIDLQSEIDKRKLQWTE